MTDPVPDQSPTTGNPGHSPGRRGHRRRQDVPIPGVDEILQQLLQLNGAVAIGVMSTKDANLIQKNLKTVLDVQMKRASREDVGPSQEALVDLCRRDPRALNAIESFLTESQLDWLMNEITDDPDAAT